MTPINKCYAHTYWAGFKQMPGHIIAARNAIAAHLRLRAWKAPWVWRSGILCQIIDKAYDHLEFYRCFGSGAALMFHTYDMSEGERKKYEAMGWQRVMPLYSDTADSYQINCQSPKHLLEFMRRAHGLDCSPTIAWVPPPLGLSQLEEN